MKITKSVIKSWIVSDFQDVCRKYYQPMLEARGYKSYKNNLLNWYKLENGVLFSINFCTVSIAPLRVLFLESSALPLFRKTGIPCPLVHSDIPWETYDVFVKVKALDDHYERTRYRSVTNRIDIHFPDTDTLGADILEEKLIQHFDRIHSEEDVYNFWIRRYIDLYVENCGSNKNFTLGQGEIDCIIYFQDEHYWELCKEQIKKSIAFTWDEQYLSAPYLSEEEKVKERRENELRKAAVEGNGRAAFLEEMERRKQEMLRIIQKKFPQILG